MRAILLTIGLFCLPMLACTVPSEVADVIAEFGLQVDMALTVEEDGSGTFEMGVGSAFKDEDGSYVLDCDDFDTSDLPPGGRVDASMRGDMVWCQIVAPFTDLATLKTMTEDEEEGEDGGLPFQCLALVDGEFYLALPTQDPAAEEEEVVPIPIPFRVTAPGPIRSHNAAEQVGNTLVWDLATAPNYVLVNMEEGDPCPGQGIVLAISLDQDGSGQATLTVPLPSALDSSMADNVQQMLESGDWAVRVSGEPETGQIVIGTRSLDSQSISGLLRQVPGLEGSGSGISLRIDDASPDVVRHELSLTLNMAQFADFWATWLPDEPTPSFTLILTPAGTLESASGDWSNAASPLSILWAPQASPDALAGSAISAVPRTVTDAPDIITETVPITDTAVATATVPVTSGAPITVVTAVTPITPVTVSVPVTPTTPVTPSVPAATAPTTPPSTPVTTTGRPLCPEATSLLVGGFDADELRRAGITDPQQSGILLDDQFLVPDFQQAIRNYNQNNPDNTAFVSPGVSSLLDAFWFASNGVMLRDFSPVQKYESLYVTGHERALRSAILRESRAKQRRGEDPHLTPGEVLELSLALNGGSMSNAMLTAHNTLRALARGDGTSPSNTFDATDGLIGIGRDLDFFRDHLVQVRTADDNAGPWYHMFGTMYMELASRGSVGLYLGGAALGGLPGAGIGVILDELNQHLSVATGATIESRIYNDIEQLVREWGSGHAPDPEKYCFNVWGAQIATMLYDELPFRATRPLSDEAFSSFTPPDVDYPAFDAVQGIARTRFLNIVQSDFSIQWEDETGRMVLDQGPSAAESSLMGSIPMTLLPIPEEDSWGVMWFSPDDRSQTVTFEAMEDGATLHYTRIDLETGDANYYESVAPSAGDRMEVTYDGGTAQPPLLDATGVEVVPESFVLESIRSEAEPPEQPPVEDDEESVGEQVTVSLPADQVLKSFLVSVESYSYIDEEELFELIDAAYALTDGEGGYDYSSEYFAEYADRDEEKAYYLVGDVEMWLEDGAWTTRERRGLPNFAVLDEVGHLSWEAFALSMLELDGWVDMGIVDYNGIEAQRLWLEGDWAAPAPYEDMILYSAELWLSAEGGYVVAYGASLEDEEGIDVVDLYYELIAPNEELTIELPSSAVE